LGEETLIFIGLITKYDISETQPASRHVNHALKMITEAKEAVMIEC
jgi:hypothetical protein